MRDVHAYTCTCTCTCNITCLFFLPYRKKYEYEKFRGLSRIFPEPPPSLETEGPSTRLADPCHVGGATIMHSLIIITTIIHCWRAEQQQMYYYSLQYWITVRSVLLVKQLVVPIDLYTYLSIG